MSAIAKLGGVKVDDERQAEIVKVLEEVLSQAKKGEFDAIVIVTDPVRSDTPVVFSSGYNSTQVLGIIERLKFSLLYRSYQQDG